ncbi:MAG TPA: tetratricopeptide repeat protein [Tepidisphaeraceae bacterium]|nr:tetratricopeptide repeat protein [Tepidisphaeraceae bacterium]
MPQPLTISQALQTAAALYQAGRLADAEQVYRQILGQNPDTPDALHALGAIALQCGKANASLQLIQRALAIRPNCVDYHATHAVVLESLGRRDEAIACARRVVANNPAHAATWTNLGNWLREAGQIDGAVAASHRAIALDPRIPEAHNHLGLALAAQNKFDAATESYRNALGLRPDFPEALNNLARVHLDRRQFADAFPLIRRALELRPNLAAAHSNFGYACHQTGDVDASIDAYRQAAAIDPRSAEIHASLGAALLSRGFVNESIAACKKAVELRPDYAEGFCNLANALEFKGEILQALPFYQKAASLRPDSALIMTNLGATLLETGAIDDAVAACRRATQLDPNDDLTWRNLGSALQYHADCLGAVECYDRALALHPDPATASNRLLALHYLPGTSREKIFVEHRQWAAQHAAATPHAPHDNDPSPERPLKIGYLSPDLRRHPVGFFLLPILRAHDRAQFHITCYSASLREDDFTRQLRGAADQWVNIVSQTDAEADRQIRHDRIDILIDLSGHTGHNRLAVFARKPAPVQATWLGYPDTTALPAMDWRITDGLADPPGAEQFHTERLMRLPIAWCFQPHQDSDPAPPRSRRHIIFGTFNHVPKLNAPLLSLWSRIIREVPDSRLLLKNRSATSPIFQTWVLDTLGISGDRVIFMPRQVDRADHLHSYEQLDIALDTFPYHGTTTTCEALWMGVPVITLAGHTHASRVGVSLLTSIGAGDLIAEDEEAYVKIAVALAADAHRLSELGSTLRSRMQASPLTNAPAFTTHLESAYRQMWRRYTRR